MDRPNYITPAGYATLRAEYERLFATERPALVETIAWAAGNGDRSENGDYIYGRKRLREIDRRLGWLSKRMKAAKVVDPAAHEDRSRIFFGAMSAAGESVSTAEDPKQAVVRIEAAILFILEGIRSLAEQGVVLTDPVADPADPDAESEELESRERG